MGHSRIIAKMSSLQRSGKLEDGGLERLSSKVAAEADYLKRFQAGQVETKKSVFQQVRSEYPFIGFIQWELKQIKAFESTKYPFGYIFT